MKKIKLLIIDNYTLFWEGLRYLNENDNHFIIQDVQGYDKGFGQLIALHEPDVLLIDADILLENKVAIMEQLKASDLNIQLAVISEETDNHLLDVMELEVVGYLLRSMEYTYYVEALQTIAQGKYWFHPLMTGPFMKRCQELLPTDEKATELAPMPAFTMREIDVLQLLVKGYSNKMIADALDITSFTVNSHIRNILKKSKANDRTHAVVLAMEHNWLREEDDNITLEAILDEA